MALLDKGEVEETYFPDCEDYILLWKLEVLENTKVAVMLKLIDFAKEKTNQLKQLRVIIQRIIS